MKILALLCGLLASAFAWGAGLYLADVGVQFLELWPQSIGQQFLGLVVWHGIVAAALVGGLLAVLSPISGAILLVAVAGGWAALAYVLPVGFVPQMIVPMVLAGLGALAAIGAMVRGRARRLAEQRGPTPEDIAREEALRFEPTEDVAAILEQPIDAPEMRQAAPMPPKPRRADEAPPNGISGAMAANVAVLLLLTGAVGLLIYSEVRSGDLMAAFSPTGPRPAIVSEGVPTVGQPALQPAGGTTSAETAVAPAVTANDAQIAVPAPAEAAAVADDATLTALADATDELSVGVPDEGPWTDPFSYCAAVGTIDFPDGRYSGPYLVADVADALGVPASSSPDRARWRCYEGRVLACAAFDGPDCAITPTVTEMVEFCRQNPNAKELDAPNGSWSCEGTQPVIPPGQEWPVDARGFFPAAWRAVAAP